MSTTRPLPSQARRRRNARIVDTWQKRIADSFLQPVFMGPVSRAIDDGLFQGTITAMLQAREFDSTMDEDVAAKIGPQPRVAKPQYPIGHKPGPLEITATVKRGADPAPKFTKHPKITHIHPM